jgi:peptidoglycan/LPS O-acetylase OafA/YrhL
MPSPPKKATSNSRLVQLDVIRAGAILLVLLNHTFSLNLSTRAWHELEVLVPLFRMGEVGVPIFFVLSGFLIGGLLLNEAEQTKSLAPGRFLVRRGFKIYPPFYLMVAAYAAYLHFFEGNLDPERLLREIFFVQNYGIGGFLDVSWSLAVEEHFYFLFAAIASWLVRRASQKPGCPKDGHEFSAEAFRPVVRLAAALMLMCWFWRCLAFLPLSKDEITRMSPTLQTHFRIDALFAGAAIAWLRFSGWNPKWLEDRKVRIGLSLLALGVLALNAIPSSHLSLHFKKTHYLLMLTMASGTLIWLSLNWKPGGNPVWKILAAIGRHSYCIYLVHVPLFRLLNKVVAGRLEGWPGFAHAAVAWVAAILAGMFMTRLIETPALRLRDRCFPPSSMKKS